MEREFVLSERELISLIIDRLELMSLHWSGVDNWPEYHEFDNTVIRECHPDGPSLDEIRDNEIDFAATAKALLDYGAYRELINWG